MKNLTLIFFLAVMIFSSCLKNENATCNYNDSNVIAPVAEVQALQTYLDTNHLTATANPFGFFYNITSQGNGKVINNLCSGITVNYKGTLVNGIVFDSTQINQPASFLLGGVIPGWQKGLPLITEGGKIRLYIPPSLGYGANSQGSIPGNSILIFDIEILSISQQ